ncbi:hypothetical protein J41TS12_37250 [Paenibacillus antibioticophila]|uniref:Uncharacterized protein n=1 Tax=Paenibacillus antibioticophila TaxID=1274374 RepID=A0A919XVQ8_9BACL|nr:hypothetical protein [Paenibacillus antibioticophila]GIO38864.1 hypothetical protein J41TS12_37250 [Paenibacillus antibioticophila]
MFFFYGLDINAKSKSLANGNTGWVKLNEDGNLEGKPDFNLKRLGESIADDLIKGNKVALGFEAPMWYAVPKVDTKGKFHMTARFKEEEELICKLNPDGTKKLNKDGKQIYESSKHWYIGGSQPMVKGYPLGLILFEAIVERYLSERTSSHPPTIAATTNFDSWVGVGDTHPLYLFEGFVTGLYKPTDENFRGITVKDNYKEVLSNNEVVDAFIVANALRAFAKKDMKSPIILRESNYPLSWVNHLRVCVEEDLNTKSHIKSVKSYHTAPNASPNTTNPDKYEKPSRYGLHPPARAMSVWEHIIRDVNGIQAQEIFELTGKKTCDVYGFKFRENPVS